MHYWLISDTHFNHAKLDNWGGRSGDWQKQIYKGIHDLVEPGDVLIHLGDICIGDDEEVHRYLMQEMIGISEPHIERILVRGNHDKKSAQWYTDHGWDFVCDGLDLTFRGHYLHLTHRPQRPRDNISWNIHGHTHGNMHRAEEYIDFHHKAYHIDISPEIVGFKPIRLDLLLEPKKLKELQAYEYART